MEVEGLLEMAVVVVVEEYPKVVEEMVEVHLDVLETAVD